MTFLCLSLPVSVSVSLHPSLSPSIPSVVVISISPVVLNVINVILPNPPILVEGRHVHLVQEDLQENRDYLNQMIGSVQGKSNILHTYIYIIIHKLAIVMYSIHIILCDGIMRSWA